MIRFGPSGICNAFYEQGFKETLQMPAWLHNQGMNAYEYSFSLGKFLSDETATKIAEEAKKNNVKVSVHAPYYINFCNITDIATENNARFLLNSMHSLKILGGNHCVFHTGAQMKFTRTEALNNIEKNLKDFMEYYHQVGEYEDMYICPETMGKYSQVGSPAEIFEICRWDKNLIPTLDFGHINCIMQGKLQTKQDYLDILNLGIEKIGYDKMKNCHIHFSRIKFNEKGEMAHLTFQDTEYGPEYQPMIDAVMELKLEPDIISESRGTQGPDAKTMQDYYKSKI